jgi:lipoprotein-releasing system ATP-binding protein
MNKLKHLKKHNVQQLYDEVVLQATNLEKTFFQGQNQLSIIKNLNLKINQGEIVALVGPSGSGKSTLLHMLGLLDKPTHGDITINGLNTNTLGDLDRTQLRRKFIGFVYQFHYLQQEFTALENVMLPQLISGMNKREAIKSAKELLQSLGLEERLEHRPARLSGGEQQRVAIARALSNKPQLILADEPTGNLDPKTSEEVFDLLLQLVRLSGVSAVIATHNLDLADRMDRVLELKGGKLIAY